jgi:hypothetical protein
VNDHVTGREFMNAIEAITRSMDAGFATVRVEIAGVNHRLDRVNGRLEKTEDQIGEIVPAVAEQDAKIANLNREVFDRGRGRRGHGDYPSEPRAESVTVSITPKVWAVIGTGVGALLMVLVEWLKRQMGAP